MEKFEKESLFSKMAGGFAHEFNNILTPLVWLIEACIRDTPSDSKNLKRLEKTLKYLLRAQNSVKHFQFFNHFIDEVRGEICLKSAINEAILEAQEDLPRNIELQVNISDNLGNINAAPKQIQQIITNLIDYAVDAADGQEGVIQINAKKTFVDGNEAKNSPHLQARSYYFITVSHSGQGIDPSKLDEIFDPYFSKKNQGKGSGIGLSIVKTIVDRHDGFILAESALGKGSTFKIYLQTLDEANGKSDNSASYVEINNRQIMFVDDDEMITDTAQDIFESYGYCLKTFCKSEEALEYFKKNSSNFDLIFLDYNMPELNGIELAKQINFKAPKVPIVMITGSSDENLPDQIKSSGISELLLKPITFEALNKVITKYLP